MNELPLPFVNDLKHLGNVLQSDNSMPIDCNKKRAIFISKIHSLNQEFYNNNPDVFLKLYNIYCCSFYGSSIWFLSSQWLQNCIQHGILLLEFFLMCLEIRLVKKQMKYFDVPLDHAWKVPILQELLNKRMNNFYVEGFDDYLMTEI